MIRHVIVVAVAVSGFAAAAPVPQNKSAELILGKWEGDGGSVTITAGQGPPKTYKRTVVITFGKDGKVTMVGSEIPELKAMNPDLAKGDTMEGTYKFVEANEIEVAIKDSKEKMRVKVVVSETELTTESMGEKVTFKRLKD